MKPPPSRKRRRRRLTEREQTLRRKYTRSVKWTRGSYGVFLQVDHQGFAINGDSESQGKSDWLRDMLAIALARVTN